MQPGINVEDDSDHLSAPIEIPEDSSSLEAIRRSHIGTETSIKAIGYLVWLGVALEGFNLVRSLGAGGTSPTGVPGLLLSVASLVAAGFCGAWLCKLDPRGRLLYTLLSIAQFVMVPFELRAAIPLFAKTHATMTIWFVGGFMLLRLMLLYILWNRKGRTVMSRHYRHAILPATPGIEYRSRAPLLILLGVLLLIAVVIALAIVSA